MDDLAPVVIGHRGAPGYRPEHTLASYRLAIEQGADFIEPDLVPTRDGVLVARHENEIGATTDIATRPEFADRATTRCIDGRLVSGWFTGALPLADPKTLGAGAGLPQVRPANTWYDGHFEVPTLDEILDLAAWGSRRRSRPVGVYPETKPRPTSRGRGCRSGCPRKPSTRPTSGGWVCRSRSRWRPHCAVTAWTGPTHRSCCSPSR